MSATRMERDSLGEVAVPEDALYGASTRRAVENFPISGYRMERSLLRALGLIKEAAAKANAHLGLLDPVLAALIQHAARELAEGSLDEHFPVDVFQTGSGTSTHMNVNEVIANRCSQLAVKPLGAKSPVHPNDHVNLGQSSNDVFPTALHLALGSELHARLIPALEQLSAALSQKAREFWPVLKIGRTHLMDATPVRLGQEFAGYARQTKLGTHRLRTALRALEELPMGGTAVGTGLNRSPDFPRLVLHHLSQATGLPWREAEDHFEAQSAKDAVVEASGHLKTVALSLFKIASDIRLMGSGPACGFGEIQLPAIQPGSSMMPGKVNPVLCESVMQVCARVLGNDATITWAAGALGNFELNTGMPVMAHAVLESARLLANVCEVFRTHCVEGIQASSDRCNVLLERSSALATGLVPILGYDRAAAIAKESVHCGKTVREICLEQNVLPKHEVARALDPAHMTAPSGLERAAIHHDYEFHPRAS